MFNWIYEINGSTQIVCEGTEAFSGFEKAPVLVVTIEQLFKLMVSLKKKKSYFIHLNPDYWIRITDYGFFPIVPTVDSGLLTVDFQFSTPTKNHPFSGMVSYVFKPDFF